MPEQAWDRELLAKLVTREMERYGSWPKMAAATGVARAILYRMKAADPTVARKTWHRLEAGLGYPMDAIDAVALRDMDMAREIGMRPDLVAWVERQIRRG